MCCLTGKLLNALQAGFQSLQPAANVLEDGNTWVIEPQEIRSRGKVL